MNFKLLGKNNIGVLITLILVVLLSQSRFFDFLINVPLGRFVLIAFVIINAYIHKILGLLSVLLVILAFNHNKLNMVYGYNLYEGFSQHDKTSNITTPSKPKPRPMPVAENTAMTTSTSVSGTETFKSREGFCMSDRETNMLRGKQSNTVAVSNNLREQSDDISPTDNYDKSNYATF